MSESQSTKRKPRRLRIGVLVGGMAAATVLTPVSASAAAGVVITDPAGGSTVSSADLSLTATSTDEKVRFVLDAGDGNITKDVVVVAGEATTTMSVAGLDGATTLDALACNDEVCDPGDSINLTIALDAPAVTSPADNAVVGNTFVAKATTVNGGSIKFTIDGDDKATDTSAPYSSEIRIGGLNDGPRTLRAVQCNADGSVCEGPTSNARTIVKDTRGPQWSNVASSPGTVFPYRDHYKDSTQLSARVGEDARNVKVEIRKKRGPVVRTLKLGAESKGRVRVKWNGRKANGKVVQPGGYTFRFIGADPNGNVSKSGARGVSVSDKRLVKRKVTKAVSAKGSAVGNLSGTCSGVYDLDYPKSRFGWSKGIGYYSKSKCSGSRSANIAAVLHKVRIPSAIRYGSASIATYGAGAFRHAGPAVVLYVKSNTEYGHGAKIGTGLGWHGSGKVNLNQYLLRHGLYWTVATQSGNWYDVKEFRVSFTYSVLR